VVHTANVLFGERRIRVVLHGMGGTRPPLLCVPGGPAMPHQYIAPVSAVQASGRAVIFFDPLGSGASDRPASATWSEEIFLAELHAVCAALGVPRVHLFAHSVASFAALPFAFERPPILGALVLASAPASMPAYQASVRELLGLTGDGLARFELADRGAIPRDAAYVRAYQAFLNANMCRARPSPPQLFEAIQQMNPVAHQRMKGGGILYHTPLARWDVTDQLPTITAPTLITCGRHDIFTPAAAEAVQRRIPGAELAVFEQSSHMPHFEEPTRYVARLIEFLDACDQRAVA
jgi:proline-specific peptidase